MLETITYKFRGRDPKEFEPALWELWFEYPSQTGEKPDGVSEGVIIGVIGHLVTEGGLSDTALSGRIHVAEYQTNDADFERAIFPYLAKAACLLRQINDVLCKDKPYTPRMPGPWDPASNQDKPEAIKAPTPAPAPAPAPAPVTGEQGPVSDMVLEPKPGEKVDTSFDPAKLSAPAAPEAPQGWGKGSGVWSLQNGQRPQAAG